MGIQLVKNQLVIDKNTLICYANEVVIMKLNNDEYFSNKSMNRWGRELVAYLCNTSSINITNPEPVDLTKNTLSKVLGRIRRIDGFVKKPLEEYETKDINSFSMAFIENRLPPLPNARRKMEKQAIGLYIKEFKRLWKIFRQWNIDTKGKNANLAELDWGLWLRPPKVKIIHEECPDYDLPKLFKLTESLLNEEYRVRTLLAVNLMSRKCEMAELTYGNIRFQADGSVWIKLPNVKKHSTDKVDVELHTYSKTALLKYLKGKEWRKDELLFPSNEPAYTKNLRERSQKLFKERVNPKTLRKIGVAIAEKNGYTREDVERIGGWEANSPVIAHYFQRGKGVAVRKEQDAKIEETTHKDLYEEMEKVQAQARIMRSENQTLKEQLEKQQKSQEQILKMMKELSNESTENIRKALLLKKNMKQA